MHEHAYTQGWILGCSNSTILDNFSDCARAGMVVSRRSTHPRGPQGELPAPTLAGAGCVQKSRCLHACTGCTQPSSVAAAVGGRETCTGGLQVCALMAAFSARARAENAATQRTRGGIAWQRGHLTNRWNPRGTDYRVSVHRGLCMHTHLCTHRHRAAQPRARAYEKPSDFRARGPG